MGWERHHQASPTSFYPRIPAHLQPRPSQVKPSITWYPFKLPLSDHHPPHFCCISHLTWHYARFISFDVIWHTYIHTHSQFLLMPYTRRHHQLKSQLNRGVRKQRITMQSRALIPIDPAIPASEWSRDAMGNFGYCADLVYVDSFWGLVSTRLAGTQRLPF